MPLHQAERHSVGMHPRGWRTCWPMAGLALEPALAAVASGQAPAETIKKGATSAFGASFSKPNRRKECDARYRRHPDSLTFAGAFGTAKCDSERPAALARQLQIGRASCRERV